MKARFTQISTVARTLQINVTPDLQDAIEAYDIVEEEDIIEFLWNNHHDKFILVNVYEQDECKIDEEIKHD